MPSPQNWTECRWGYYEKATNLTREPLVELRRALTKWKALHGLVPKAEAYDSAYEFEADRFRLASSGNQPTSLALIVNQVLTLLGTIMFLTGDEVRTFILADNFFSKSELCGEGDWLHLALSDKTRTLSLSSMSLNETDHHPWKTSRNRS